MFTHEISPDFLVGVLFSIQSAIRDPVNLEFIGSPDGVHCRESAGTEPVVVKEVPVTGAAFASPWTN